MQNSIIGRVKDHQEHTTAMLTPWLRKTVQKSAQNKGNTGKIPFLPGLRQNVIHLKKNSNIIQRQSFDNFSRNVVQKYVEAREFIPLVPKFERGKGFWGELERIFPSASAERNEEPAQPGEMRRGTIIQKMETFPKTGQTFADFKGQMDQPFKRQQKKVSEVKRKPVAPGQRLFARVTEINPKIQPEVPAAEGADEPIQQHLVADKTGFEETLKSEEQTAHQPAQEPPSPLRDIPVEVKAPSAQQPASMATLRQLPQPSKRAEAAKKTKAVDQAVVHTPTQKPVPSPVGEKLPKAKAVKKSSAQQPELKKALLSSASKEKSILQVKPNSISNRVVQRSPDLPQRPDLENPQSPSLPASLPPIVAESTRPELGTGVEKVDLPIRRTVNQPKPSANTLSRRSDSFLPQKPAAQSVPVNTQKQSVLTLQNKRLKKDESAHSEETANRPDAYRNPLPFDLPASRPAVQQRAADSLPLKKSNEPISRLPQIEPAVNPQQPEQVAARPPKPVVQNATRQVSMPVPSTAAKVVQRELDSPAAVSSPDTPEPPDYKKLAEDVFPFVKHLLEIENERTRGSSR